MGVNTLGNSSDVISQSDAIFATFLISSIGMFFAVTYEKICRNSSQDNGVGIMRSRVINVATRASISATA